MSAKKTSTKKVNKAVLDCLNEIYQAEMAGVMRYLHYSFMIMGHNRIPIQKWFRDQAAESMDHATIIGEKLTAMGGHPSIEAVKVEETGNHAVSDLLTESLSFELETLDLYKDLVKMAKDDIALDEMARSFVRTETEHVEEVEKMLTRPEQRQH
jgi:bacterioferritin